MTTRQDQFKAEMAAIFKKYQVEMEVVEDTSGYASFPTGVQFYSFVEVKKEDGEHSHFDKINFKTGTWANFQDFE